MERMKPRNHPLIESEIGRNQKMVKMRDKQVAENHVLVEYEQSGNRSENGTVMKNNNNLWNLLPTEMLAQILEYLEIDDLINLEKFL